MSGEETAEQETRQTAAAAAAAGEAEGKQSKVASQAVGTLPEEDEVSKAFKYF